MTENRIEQQAERDMDRLDRKLIRGAITQGEYDAEVWALEQRTRKEYDRARTRH